ncbi:hypothetical protein NEUTE1DRAFT_96006 [Neurospora tetrasperma FGSC 2508]|uniref:Uncharacterized protein n=1 Tax=Neurospora tetrasperma (strain FGSC 2508 / ATCC MYA-4615 / P0657) TaxID=510951 RepID=F8MWR3_NEUT8|nr:uncharacterized protein NEUTE1DRAFT_96006 [Neurospora tetrasperma FGSC 2508]EGO54184.1 hypothetical protein NEUTE1DRAFT_96006 [Neurospora tetrasperma FGSC 2508]EGZ68385.1 hypothetical protein NEUTE2DRAFT_122602 [Neurospora tetrasperma FGSC 2509]
MPRTGGTCPGRTRIPSSILQLPFSPKHRSCIQSAGSARADAYTNPKSSCPGISHTLMPS